MGYCQKPGHGIHEGNTCPKCAALQKTGLQVNRLPSVSVPRAVAPNPVPPKIHFDKIPMINNRIGGTGASDWDTFFSPHYHGPNAAMDSIKQLLTEYWKIYSPIATGNFNPDQRRRLSSLKSEVATWMGSKPANDPLRPSMEALKRIVERTLQAMPAPPPRSYNSVVCIGLKIVTGNFDSPVSATVKYTGAWNDRIDMNDKCTRLRKVITQALQNYQTQFRGLSPAEHNDTLKIFMAPEFLFRGKQGGYDMSVVADILPAIRLFTSGADYKHWLFVLGTAVAATRINPFCSRCHKATELLNDPQNPLSHRMIVWCKTCKREEPTPPKMMLDNFAVIQKGGDNAQTNAHLIQKEYISKVDFRRPNTNLNWENPNNRQVEVRGLEAEAIPSEGSSQAGSIAPSVSNDERMGGSAFTMDGIRFGLEVCRDHIEGRLVQSNAANPMQIHIQLIPSSGLGPLQPANLIAPIAFNVDGSEDGPQVEVRNNGVAVPLNQHGDIFISNRIAIPN